MKKFFIIVLIIVIIFVAVYFGKDLFVDNTGYVCLDINPSVEFVVNSKNNVISANPLNDDAQLVLTEFNPINMNYAVACEKFIDSAIELGFINIDATENLPASVLITTFAHNNSRKSSLETAVLKKLDNYFLENGIWGMCWTEQDLPELKKSAAALELSAAKYRVIKSILADYQEKTIDELAKMSTGSLLSMVKDKKPMHKLIAEYEDLKTKLESKTSLTSEESAQLSELKTKLAELNSAKDKLIADNALLKQSLSATVNAFRANKFARSSIRRSYWNLFKSNHKIMPQSIADNFMQLIN